MAGSGTRMTRQRLMILEELVSSHDHPTADEVYERVRARIPNISLGTVYRNLDKLAGAGIIRKLDYPGSRMRFDGDVHCHQHIRCISCGRIMDIEEAPGKDGRDLECAAGSGFRSIERRVEYTGICPACDAARKET